VTALHPGVTGGPGAGAGATVGLIDTGVAPHEDLAGRLQAGIDLLREIRQREPTLPVILATGYSGILTEIGSETFELLRKPYSIEALSQLIRKVQRQRLAP